MRRLRYFLSICAFLLIAAGGSLLAGCGSSKPHAPVTRPTLARVCPIGHSAMGCANRVNQKPTAIRLASPAGGIFPDVYEGQGTVNWSAVKSWQLSHGWRAAGIFKLGEYRLDTQAARNASETSRLGFWRAGYWFLRSTGCAHESAQIVAAGRQLRLKVIVLDSEVPEAAGYVGCVTPPLKAAGFIVVVYTAPGTWPGGQNLNLPLWVATYGPHFLCVWTCHPIAWQFTGDGIGPPPHCAPGIACGSGSDLSIDYGITKLGAAPVDPLHRAWYAPGPFKTPYGNLDERQIVQHYDGARQHPAKYVKYLGHLRGELRYLAGRVSFVSHHPLSHGKPTWHLYHRGWRYQQLIHRAEGKRLI